MNPRLWMALLRRCKGIPRSREEREAIAEKARKEAQGPATKKDWQRWEAERK